MQAVDVKQSGEPLVVIVGRPNVGKSTLFNRLVGTRRAIVGDEPGITRDRLHGRAEWRGVTFEIVDTGGIIPDEDAAIPAGIFRQAQAVIEVADALLLVVDVREGILPVDSELARLLHKVGIPVFVLANKADTIQFDPFAEEFRRLGFEHIFPISAEHGSGIGEMLDELAGILPSPEKVTEPSPDHEISLAIIGRPNVGKSSLVNRLLGAERVIVSPEPGTTRDAVDTELTMGETRFRLIDTAGIRRRSRVTLRAEKIAVVMAHKHLQRADVAVLLIDALDGPTTGDAKIAGLAHESGTSLILAVNKWDLITKDRQTAAHYEAAIRQQMKFADYAPVVFISALTGQRVTHILELAQRAYAARHHRVPTAELNRFFERYLAESNAPFGSTPIRYLTQAATEPPTFVVFTAGRKKGWDISVERYLINRLRETYSFFATPIRIKQKFKPGGTRRR
jgi:GTP-binding protein